MIVRTFVMAGGGTGGHIVPSLAVAGELKRRGHKAVFIGTKKGLEAKLVPDAGYPLEWIDIDAMKGMGLRAALRMAAKMPRAVSFNEKLNALIIDTIVNNTHNDGTKLVITTAKNKTKAGKASY